MPTPKRQRRRALELLDASHNGCTEAVMLANGFSVDVLADLIRAGLAKVSTERVMAGNRKVEVARWRITEAGRRALAETMRTVFVLASALLSGSALADTVRHPSVPERFWGTWAPTAELCRDDKSIIVVSAKGYVTAQASCAVQWVIATAGAGGPIYSAHMRCSSPSTPDQKTELNRIIVPIDNDQLSAGVDFKDLKSYQRCPAN